MVGLCYMPDLVAKKALKSLPRRMVRALIDMVASLVIGKPRVKVNRPSNPILAFERLLELILKAWLDDVDLATPGLIRELSNIPKCIVLG